MGTIFVGVIVHKDVDLFAVGGAAFPHGRFAIFGFATFHPDDLGGGGGVFGGSWVSGCFEFIEF